MWFKNLQVHATPKVKQAAATVDSLEACLAEQPFSPCSKVTAISMGWVPPIGEEGAPFVYASQGYLLFCLKIEEKILPPAVIKEQHAEQVRELEEKQERPLFRDEKNRMKDELYFTLLSKAFTKSTRIYAYIDTHNKHLIIDTNSKSKADLFFKCYNKLASDFSAQSLELQTPGHIMTQWLHNQRYPGGISITEQCTLEDPHDYGGVARFQRTDLLSDGVQSCLKNGSQVVSLGLNWHDQVLFNLKDDFSISSVKFLEGVQELAKDGITETDEERFAANFAIMSETVAKFLKDLLPAFIEEKAVAEVA